MKTTIKTEAVTMGFSPQAAALLGSFAKATQRRKRAVNSLKTAVSVAKKNEPEHPNPYGALRDPAT